MNLKPNLLLSLLSAWSHLSSLLLPLLARRIKHMYKRIIQCDRKALTAYYLDVNDADVASVTVNSDGRIASSTRPTMLPFFQWMYEVVKVLKLAQQVYGQAYLSESSEKTGSSA